MFKDEFYARTPKGYPSSYPDVDARNRMDARELLPAGSTKQGCMWMPYTPSQVWRETGTMPFWEETL
jgi:hypothetical protein